MNEDERDKANIVNFLKGNPSTMKKMNERATNSRWRQHFQRTLV